MTYDPLADGPPIMLDCSYPEAHASAHGEHPLTSRLCCYICHPPLATGETRREEPDGEAA